MIMVTTKTTNIVFLVPRALGIQMYIFALVLLQIEMPLT
jgi:hypothetical protein